MKFCIRLLFCVLFSLVGVLMCLPASVRAQGLSKEEEKIRLNEEKKVWKKKAKYYRRNPLILKAREEALEAEREQVRAERERCQAAYKDLDRILQSEKYSVQKELISARVELDSMQRVEDSLRFAVGFLADSLDEIHKNKTFKQKDEQKQYKRQVAALRRAVVGTDSSTAGIYYSVQIGAIYRGQSRQIPLSLENFIVDTADGINQYLVGRFGDYSTAEKFKNEVRQFGIKDAFVVAFQDGKRLSLRKARKELRKQPNATQAVNRNKVENEELKERLKGLQEEINRLKNQMDTVKSSKRQAQAELQRVQKLYELTLREINTMNRAEPAAEPVYTPPAAEKSEKMAINNNPGTGLYKIQVYSGGFAGAELFKKKCMQNKVRQPVSIEYEKPYNKVRVGEFNSYSEAMRYRDEIRIYFPDAFVVRKK